MYGFPVSRVQFQHGGLFGHVVDGVCDNTFMSGGQGK